MVDIQELQKEISFKTSRSGGPGGQHVNKVETKVTLIWDLRHSQLFSAEEKTRLEQQLFGQIKSDGFLQLSSSKSRSQSANKEEVLNRLVHLIVDALRPVKKRVPTKVPRSKVLERLDRKKKQSAKKMDRKWRME